MTEKVSYSYEMGEVGEEIVSESPIREQEKKSESPIREQEKKEEQ